MVISHYRFGYNQVKGPSGEQIQDFRDRVSEKFEFVAHTKGLYRFCFNNKSPYHETIDFDVHVGHFAYYDQHAKDGEQRLYFLLCVFSSILFFLLSNSIEEQ